ncbi:MAG: sulfatase-like hydrolase/transferase [Eubacteriales bacterium]|nr:sulfatase-like hydrolase/transferase [Eubacteriales bacterium]
MKKKIWNSSNRKVIFCNSITALLLNIFLEYMERKSMEAVLQFIHERTFVFLFNALILFMFLSLVFLARKKVFTYAMIAGGWFLIGVTNGIVLNGRKTPFTAVDLTLVKSILPILNSYLELWQILLMVLGIIVVVAVIVCLYLYSPETKKSFDMKTNLGIVAVLCLFFAGVSYVGVGRGQLIKKFDNLIAGYKDYGVVYGFCVTALDTGIDRPINYSKERMKKLERKIETALDKDQNKKQQKTPNIIFVQLESFFDITKVKGLHFSEDPIPNMHRLQEEYTSGRLKVPVYGAGTINTEFEVITGMNAGFFGTGEYPYRSVLQKKTCESIAYWLKDLSYESTVIHNNNATFYDRNKVLSNLGFDNFLSIENMQVKSKNEVGWAKDSMLTDYILDTMRQTEKQDVIYTISVQGHGDYPTHAQENAKIQVEGVNREQSYLNQVTYYANQLYEMDQFIGDLAGQLAQWEEDAVLICYGDHLPGLDIETKGLSSGSKYETPYFIWDNFGYNKEHKEAESEDVAAWQLASKVLAQVNITEGKVNQFHQTMKGTKNEKNNLKLLQYDMLYGADFIREGEEELKPTTLCYSLEPVEITKIKTVEKRLLLLGNHFNRFSRVYVNGIQISSVLKSSKVMEIKASSVKEGDEITIHQVSKTNEKITLNRSAAYEFSMEKTEPLYKISK